MLEFISHIPELSKFILACLGCGGIGILIGWGFGLWDCRRRNK